MKSINQQIEEYNSYKITNNEVVKRFDIINAFIKKFNYTEYLEIGVHKGDNFKKIQIKNKKGVDSGRDGVLLENIVNTTSDNFFESIKNYEQLYDIIFIDGLHFDYQVYADILNCLKHLKENGTIVCHDMNPLWEITQRKESVIKCWHGDCWKAWVKIRSEFDNLEMYVIDTDGGCGVIRRGKQQLIKLPTDAFNLDFDYLDVNRKLILNLIGVEIFYKKIND